MGSLGKGRQVTIWPLESNFLQKKTLDALALYSRTCIKRSPLGKGQVTAYTGWAEYMSYTKSLS